MRRCYWSIVGALIIIFLSGDLSPGRTQSDLGHFEGVFPVATVDGRWRLQWAGAYVDPDGRRWEVPADVETDGASIPRLIWAAMGHPFEPKYIKAAILHDYYCEYHKTHSSPPHQTDWREVHRMFYWALRAGGTDEVTAKQMYAGVYYFGPRWFPDRYGRKVVWRGILNELQASRISSRIVLDNPSLGEIEHYAVGEIRYEDDRCFKDGVFKGACPGPAP